MPIDPQQTDKAFNLNNTPRQSNTNIRATMHTEIETVPTEAESSCCRFCDRKNHVSEACKTYPTAAKRIERLPSFTCHICLVAGHIRQFCPSNNRCKICDSRYHHTALCPTKFGYFRTKLKSEKEAKTTSATETVDTKATQELAAKDSQKTVIALLKEIHSCYLTARAQIRNPINGREMNVRIFLDCGCPRTFILTQTVRDMEFTAIGTTNLAIGVFLHPEVEELKTERIQLQIIDQNTNEPHTITASTTPRITDKLGITNITEFCKQYPQFKDLNLVTESDDEKITLLIGNDHLWKFILPEKKIELEENLYLINTLFGWMIVGSRENEQPNNNQVRTMHVSTKIITALWSLDVIGINDTNLTESEEEEMAIKQFNATIRHIPNENRYEVGLPFRELEPKIPTNYGLAKAMLFSLLRKYSKKLEYLRARDEIFRQQIQSEIIEPAPNLEPHGRKQHYLPYHFVERMSKSTPIRVVYNGSAKTKKSNLSLNKVLYKGVNILNDLVGILLRFRLRTIALVSDIEKAFHQITLIPEHRDYVRFLWVEDYQNGNIKIIVYRFRRIPFGVISSPFILAATIIYHISSYNTPNTERISCDIYADNIITTFDTESEAIEFYYEATKIFNDAGMPLRQWQSNSPQVQNAITAELREADEQIKILGLCWNTQADTIALNIPTNLHNPPEVTMLNVLQILSQIYDPLGLFTPVSIRSRMLVQRLHQQEYEWETQLTEEEKNEWSEIFTDFLDLKNITFCRTFLEPGELIESSQLHVFSDASIHAYAAAVYLQIKTATKTSVHLLMAKSRVTPLQALNRLTIPRLELMAALLGSCLLKRITKTLDLQHQLCTIHWIDSKCVLQWLNTKTALPIFVRNRIAEIKQNENVSYRYVPSENNPADLASRGTRTVALHDTLSMWWHGPRWLKKEENHWPAQLEITESEPSAEEVNVQSITTVVKEKRAQRTPFDIKAEDFTSYRTLLRATATCIQFLRKHSSERVLHLFPNEEITSITYATHLWIKSVQENAFTDVIKLLKENRASNMIKKFRLFLDEEGIIRAAGRLHYAPLTYEEKNPILLPKPTECHMVRLLILHLHETKAHSGVKITLSILRKHFWIPSGIKQVGTVLRACNACRKEKAKPYKQPEDSILPLFRLQDKIEPFSHIGLDIVGHFWIQNTKRWILVVTCLVVQAIALEDLSNLETETIMLALQRIQARTTKFVFYLSDNAPQFWVIKSVIEQNATETFTWKFLPAFMPWAGGVYERLMKPVKSSLYATFRQVITVSETQFRTNVQLIASVMNQRPLTFQGEEFDGTPLTPNDLLRIQFTPIEPSALITSSDTQITAYLKHNMKVTYEVVSNFWNVWSREYLQFLKERSATINFKKCANKCEPRIGDVVLLHDPILKQRNWHLGVIHQLQRSEDNAVRSAVVRLRSKQQGTEIKHTTVVRPVQKLYFLELNELEDQGEKVPQGDKIEHSKAGIENIQMEEEPGIEC